MFSRLPDLIDALNEGQRAAVLHEDGPALVVAGAGSGKTRVVTLRIARLIAEAKADAESILAVTFTNKAANEMKERVADLIGRGPASLVTVTTFHSFCVKILREHIERLGYRRNFSIAGEGDSRTLLRRVLSDLQDTSGPVSADLAKDYISRMKALADPDDLTIESGETVAKEANRDKYREWMPEIYDRYQSALRASNSVDFDDLIALVLRLWESEPAVLEACRSRYRVLLVDEYQDTNRAQFDLIRMLAGDVPNLVAVGDDDQSIYGWRGADIRNILHFERHFPGAALYTLNINYRCSGRILDVANAVIANNRQRRPKELVAANPAGRRPERVVAVDSDDEARIAASRIEQIRRQTGAPFGDFAVLYRSNSQSRPFEIAFRQAGIPYTVHGGQAFFERAEIRDVLAYLRLILNPYDETAFLRIVNVPRRGIGDVTLETIHSVAAQQNSSFGKAMASALQSGTVAGGPAEGLRAFLGLIKRHRQRFARREAKLDELIHALIAEAGYRQEVERVSRTPEAAALKWENIDALVRSAGEFEAQSAAPSLRSFIDDVSLDVNSPNRQQEFRTEAVNLMTIHSAKGLEFPFVFVAGLEEGLLPHGRSAESTAGLEEERRLFYVAVTRARQLTVFMEAASRARGDRVRQCKTSRFIDEVRGHVQLRSDLESDEARAATGGAN